jgi:predicted enzyme related to lactoylglutathione lyase
MGKVVGLGGVFFKAADKKAVTEWYARVLGVEAAEWGAMMFANPDVGFQQLAPFDAGSDYFKPSDQPFMLNLIVDDMDGVLERVRGAGVEPLGHEDHEYGRFAWLVDPAGIKIELWQPKGPSPV